MAWRLAKSLETLRNQVNAFAPNRSKASDGTIGDASHAAVPSDHNPNSAGVVTAMDITHDPANFNAHAVADVLITHRHPELKYVISNRRIAGGWTNWKWQAYNGSNPHDKHIHISVGVGNDGKSQPPYDSTQQWNIIGGSMPNYEELANLRSKAIQDAQEAVYLPRHDSNDTNDVNKRTRLINGDVDNLLKDVGITPTQADYDALRAGPKEFVYYLQNRLKNLPSQGFTRVGSIDGVDIYKKN